MIYNTPPTHVADESWRHEVWQPKNAQDIRTWRHSNGVWYVFACLNTLFNLLSVLLHLYLLPVFFCVLSPNTYYILARTHQNHTNVHLSSFALSLSMFVSLPHNLTIKVPRHSIATEEPEVGMTLGQNIMYGLSQVNDFLFRNSYILSNIIMMVRAFSNWGFLNISLNDYFIS